MVSFAFRQAMANLKAQQDAEITQRLAPVPTDQTELQNEITKYQNEFDSLSADGVSLHGAAASRYTAVSEHLENLKAAQGKPQEIIQQMNQQRAKELSSTLGTLNTVSNSGAAIGGGVLGGGDNRGTVVSTSRSEDLKRTGYTGNVTLGPGVENTFAVPEDGGIFSDRTTSVPNPLRTAQPSRPSSYDTTPSVKPQRPRVQVERESTYNPYGSNSFQKPFNPLGESLPEQPAGARAGVKSIVPPIQNRPLTGSTITARQLKDIQSGKVSQESVLGLNQNRLSSKILPDIVPSSTAFLSIPGSNELILPRPPIKPTSLSYTQEQVNNLTESDYKKYLADADRYNSQVAQFVKDVDSYNKQSERETEIKAREYVSSQIRNGQSSFIIKSSGESKNVSPQRAVSEYKKALTKDPNAILTAPQLIQLSESLNITDKPLGVTGFYQNEKGNVRTEISEIKPSEPIFRPNQFIPISVNSDFSVTGLGTLNDKRELLNLGPSETPKPRQEPNDIVSNINKFSKGIEEASQRGSQNYLTQTLGEAGKDLYSTGIQGLNLINEYVVQPLQPKPKGIREVKEDLFYAPPTLTGIGAGSLVSAAKSQVEGKNAGEQLSKGYEEAGKYVGKYGPATIIGAGISIVAPTPAGGKLSPLKIGRQTFEIVPETGIKYNKVILKGTNEAGEIRSETFKSVEDATRRQQELIEKGISKDAKIHTEYTPVSSLQFVGNSLITKIGNKYYFGGLKGRVGELTEQYKKLNPIEPIEIATLKPFSRDTLLSDVGNQALVESGRALPRDIQALKIQVEITDIINKNRKYIKPKDYGNLTAITSLKTPQEQEVLLEEILPSSKVPTKGHAAEIAQVNPDILNQVATRATTGDIDRDFVLAEPLRKIGLGSIAERISYRAAKKDAERSQKLLQDVATGKRTFEVRGTKVYAVEEEGKTKVLENLTEKEATGKGSPISDFGKIFGSKYRYNIVKGLSPKGKKIPYRSIEDQLYSKIASISRLQSSKTGLFEQGGTPDYLPSGKFQTTPEGFTIRTDLHRVKDFVDSIKLDIPEIGSRLKKSGKKTVAANLEKLGKELESLYPEVDFGATPNIAEDLAQNAPIPSIFSRVGITPNSVAKYSTGGISPLTTSKASKPSPPQNNNIKSLVSNIGGSTSRLSTFSSISSKSILSDIVSNVKSPLSQTKSPTRSIIKSSRHSSPSISNRSSSPNSPLSKLSGLSGLSKISPVSLTSPISPSSPITPISPISPISPILPIKPKKPIPPIPPVIPKIPIRLNTRRKRFPHVEGLGKRTLFYTNPSDPLAPGVILKAGVPELESASPKIFKEVDVLLRKARKRKGSTYGVYQPYRGLELKKIVGSGFKGTNLLSQKIHI